MCMEAFSIHIYFQVLAFYFKSRGKDFCKFMSVNDTLVVSAVWHLSLAGYRSEARVDFILIQTLLLFICKSFSDCYHANYF